MQLHAGKWLSTVMAVLVVSIGVNVLQAQKIRTLVSPPAVASTVIGKQVLALRGVSPTGEPVEVAIKGALPTVVYHFSTSCVWCARNWENLEAVAAGAAGRYRVLAVTSEKGVHAYLRQHGISVEVVEQIGPDMERLLNLAGTPKTIAIGSDGVVTHEWLGAYQNRTGRQIEELFGISLPGVAPAASSGKAN